MDRRTLGPAQGLGPKFHKFATLAANTPADIVIFDPDNSWVVDVNEFESKGKNTPLAGCTLKGQVLGTLVKGEIVFQKSEFLVRVEEIG